MDRTERLFAVMDALRRHRRPVTAAALAEEHGVSVRTMYRDVRALIGLGAPIEGEAGLGYVLRPGFFLPPLMFAPEELEALVLGARWVRAQPDEELAAAARAALAKIAAAAPEDLRDRIADLGLWPVALGGGQEPLPVLGPLRWAMREERAVRLAYEDAEGCPSERMVWPVQVGFYEGRQIVAAWCCLRGDFRDFRTDRIRALEVTGDRYGRRRALLYREWRQGWAESE